jgi:hypothetical protein
MIGVFNNLAFLKVNQLLRHTVLREIPNCLAILHSDQPLPLLCNALADILQCLAHSENSVALCALCVPGMGMILWGVSPLYIIQKDTFYMITLKSTSRWQGWTGDRSLERSLSANLQG